MCAASSSVKLAWERSMEADDSRAADAGEPARRGRCASSRVRSDAGDVPGEVRRLDVAAAEDGNMSSFWQVAAVADQGGHGHGARRLEHQPQLLRGEGDGRDNLFLGHQQHAVERGFEMVEWD